MKILYHHRIASKDGQYVHVEEMIKALRHRGHEIVIVAPAVMDNDQFGSEGGLVSSLKKYLPKFVYELLEFAYSIVVYFKLVRACQRHHPDCLYERYNLFMPSGVWLKRRFRLPMLSEVNAPIFSERAKYNGIALKRLASWSESYVWNHADKVLPVTSVLADMILKTGVSPKAIKVIPNGIDLDKFKTLPDKNQAKQKLGLADRFVLGFTGFVREWHGMENVVDFVADHADENLHLLLVGDGPARAELEKRAKQRGVANRISFTGIVQREQIIDYVAAFDIALQPDVVAYASPLKLFEYMILARPIVAPNTPNIREVLSDQENAVLFDLDESDGLVRAVNKIYKDKALSQKIGQAARQTIFDQNYTWANNAEIVEKLFLQLMQRSDT